MKNNENTNVKEKIVSIPIYEQIIYFSIFIVISFIISFFFLKYFVNMNEISKIILCFCYFYFTLFFFYQLIVCFDLVIAFSKSNLIPEQSDFSISFIKNYYFYFSCFSYFLSYLFLPIYSGFLQSGYIKTWKRFVDALIYHYILLSIAVVIIICSVIIFIIFTDEIMEFYENYGSLILNSLNFYSLIQIYINVGFFIIHNFIDCRRKCKRNLNDKYYLHFISSVVEKINKDTNKINDTYQELSKEIVNSNLKIFEPNYFQNISILFKKAKENNEIYKINFDGKPKNNVSSLKIFEEDNNKIDPLILPGIIEINKNNSIINENNNITNEENNIIKPFRMTFTVFL